jgi:tRNA pseudouridine38-40 synthase
MRVRVTLAYDGLRYSGFQRQANTALTIQGEVEAALERIAGQPVGIVGAGRTDAGVHASGQVIAFDIAWRHSMQALRDALNANLPEDIAALDAAEAPAGFHPRYDARSRTYVYRMYTAPVRNPLIRQRAWHVAGELDAEAAQAAAASLVGEHDFTSFGTPPQGENAVRTVYEARWQAGPDGEHAFTITANAFLFHMVRSIVGTLAQVGQGRMTAAEFHAILAACERGLTTVLAPPQGLTLVAVDYGE